MTIANGNVQRLQLKSIELRPIIIKDDVTVVLTLTNSNPIELTRSSDRSPKCNRTIQPHRLYFNSSSNDEIYDNDNIIIISLSFTIMIL